MLNINNFTPINFCGRHKKNKATLPDIEEKYNNMKIEWIDTSENLSIPPETFQAYLIELDTEKLKELSELFEFNK